MMIKTLTNRNLAFALVITLIALIIAYTVVNVNCNTFTKMMVQKTLGVRLPESVTNVYYEKQPETTEFATPYHVYVKVKLSEEEYLKLVKELGLSLVAETNTSQSITNSRLMSGQYVPIWWKVGTAKNGSLHAEGRFLNAIYPTHGWMVSMYWSEHAYIVAYEVSNEEAEGRLPLP